MAKKCDENFYEELEIYNAQLEMDRARREITVLMSQIDTTLKKISAIMYSLMENSLYDEEIAFDVIRKLDIEVNILKDRVKNNEWDTEFYSWWIEEAKSGNPDVFDAGD